MTWNVLRSIRTDRSSAYLGPPKGNHTYLSSQHISSLSTSILPLHPFDHGDIRYQRCSDCWPMDGDTFHGFLPGHLWIRSTRIPMAYGRKVQETLRDKLDSFHHRHLPMYRRCFRRRSGSSSQHTGLRFLHRSWRIR